MTWPFIVSPLVSAINNISSLHLFYTIARVRFLKWTSFLSTNFFLYMEFQVGIGSGCFKNQVPCQSSSPFVKWNGSWNENLHAWVAQRWHFSIVLTCRLAFTLLITVHKLHYQDSACHFSKISYYIPTSVGLQRNQIPKLFSFWIRWFHSLSFGSSGSGIPIQSPF